MELIQEKESFWIPVSNLYLDEALKNLTAREFKTYLVVTKIIKEIGPNTQKYFSNKKNLHKKVGEYYEISHQTFLKHLKKFDEIGILTQINSKTLDIGYSIADAKTGGYTALELILLDYLIPNLDPNELKLYITILRLLRGFNKKSGSYSYKVLRTWSGIKNKAIYTDTRNSLQKKKLISTLFDTESQKYVFKLNDISELVTKNYQDLHNVPKDKELHKQDLEPQRSVAHTEIEQHINKYSFSKNKYSKKSSSKENSDVIQKSSGLKNLKLKIFSFMSEHFKTKHMDLNAKESFLEELLRDLRVNGDFTGKSIKISALRYLSLENEKSGRVIDKIIERVFNSKEKIKKQNDSRQMYLNAFRHYFPEKVTNIEDFKNNDLSAKKLDNLIRISPAICYFRDEYIYVLKQDLKKVSDSSVFEGDEEFSNMCLEEKMNAIFSLPSEKEKSVKEKLIFNDFLKRYVS